MLYFSYIYLLVFIKAGVHKKDLFNLDYEAFNQLLPFPPLYILSRTKPADLQQICNRSVLPKTDKLQTNLLSA